MPKNMSIPDRWWQKVDRRGPDECWPWVASRDTGVDHGDVPAGHVVMHSCDNPWCVNPAHLSIGTSLDNNDDKVAKGRHAVPWGTPLTRSHQTHCKRGHLLEGNNVWLDPKRGHRHCRTCGNLHARRSYRRKMNLPGDGQPRPPKEVTVGRGQS